MKGKNNSRGQMNDKRGKKDDNKQQASASPEMMDELQREADKERSRKPGSQSNSSKQHNNGRGGGK